MMICINCLGNRDPVRDVQVGAKYGFQQDPSMHTIPLCIRGINAAMQQAAAALAEWAEETV